MPVSELSVRASQLDVDRWLISASGELDLHTVDPLRQALENAIREQDGDVVVDLDGVSVFDSIAIGILANAAARLRQQGRALTVVSGDAEWLSPFVRTGLDRVIRLRRTLAETFQDA